MQASSSERTGLAARQDVQQRGLAGPADADERSERARPEDARDALQDLQLRRLPAPWQPQAPGLRMSRAIRVLPQIHMLTLWGLTLGSELPVSTCSLRMKPVSLKMARSVYVLSWTSVIGQQEGKETVVM